MHHVVNGCGFVGGLPCSGEVRGVSLEGIMRGRRELVVLHPLGEW